MYKYPYIIPYMNEGVILYWRQFRFMLGHFLKDDNYVLSGRKKVKATLNRWVESPEVYSLETKTKTKTRLF